MSEAVAKRLGNPNWVKGGRSPNPTGRPKAALDVQALAKEHTVEAIEALVRGLRDPKHYVQAAEALLSRGWGKPIQAVTADATLSVVELHLIAAQTVSGELVADLEQRLPNQAEPADQHQPPIDPLSAPPAEE